MADQAPRELRRLAPDGSVEAVLRVPVATIACVAGPACGASSVSSGRSALTGTTERARTGVVYLQLSDGFSQKRSAGNAPPQSYARQEPPFSHSASVLQTWKRGAPVMHVGRQPVTTKSPPRNRWRSAQHTVAPPQSAASSHASR